jgi:arylsulfatase A-like enzyme
MLEALDRLNISDNTLVIFSSDNGPARASGPTELELQYDTATGAGWGIAAAKGITAGRKGYKASLFQGGVEVPFIARWPGKISAGVVDKVSLISAVDLLPTFCELAGVNLPSSYVPDGMSQVSVLMGRKEAGSREISLLEISVCLARSSKSSRSLGILCGYGSNMETGDKQGFQLRGTLRHRSRSL